MQKIININNGEHWAKTDCINHRKILTRNN